MKETRIALLAQLVTTALLVAVLWQTHVLTERNLISVEEIMGNEQVITSDWNGGSPVRHVVISTVREPNEELENWLNRHAEAVDAAMRRWPPQ